MAVPRGRGQNGGHFYSNVTQPIEIDLNFTIDSTNNNGLGVRSIKSNGYVENVFMTTSPTATTFQATFASGITVIQVTSAPSTFQNLFYGQTVTDTTTSGNIASGTTITAFNAQTGTVTLSKATLGASAASPGDSMSAVFSTAGYGNGKILNPNPVAGYAVVQFKNNFNYYPGGFSGFAAPLTSTSTTSLTAGNAYVITSLGTTTTAQWVTAGLQAGFTPAVGSAFIAATTASLSGTGTVGLPAASPLLTVSVVGDPNQTLNNSSIASNAGAYLILQFNQATSTSTTTPVATAPANNTVAAMTFKFDCSSVSIPDGGPANTSPGTSGL